MGLVRDVNVNAVAIMDEVEGQTELDREVYLAISL